MSEIDILRIRENPLEYDREDCNRANECDLQETIVGAIIENADRLIALENLHKEFLVAQERDELRPISQEVTDWDEPDYIRRIAEMETNNNLLVLKIQGLDAELKMKDSLTIHCQCGTAHKITFSGDIRNCTCGMVYTGSSKGLTIEKPGETKSLTWSEHSKPTDEISYDHTIAETPFGRILITWKGHKEDPWASIDEFPGGIIFEGSSPKGCKEFAEKEYNKRRFK